MTYDALTKAGVPAVRLGKFLSVCVNFLIPRLHHLHDGAADQQTASAPSRRAPPATAEDIVLLREIRDSLRR
jgi:large conductance mechanosensitive channel